MTFLMKIVLTGDGGVGKTAIRERYLGRGFQSKYMMTIGADFALKEAVIDGRSIKFQIWDLAGQQRFGAVRSVYYLGCLGALLLFDVTRRESFENLQSWIKEIWNHNGKGVIPIVLLGNKVDLRDQYPDSISNEVAERYCAKLSEQTQPHGFDIRFLETSAKTGLNVAEAFDVLGQVYFEYLEKQKKK
ncbi:MAG: GTP-binding protein [Candidatus Hodarchaeales archaeon]|jgi:small GTP-binding protein